MIELSRYVRLDDIVCKACMAGSCAAEHVMSWERKDDAVDRIYDQQAEQHALALIVEARYRRMLKAMHEILSDAFDIRESFRLTDADTEALLQIAAEQVVRIDETTRDAIREQLQIGQRLGLSTYEIAHGRPDLGYHGIEGLYEETFKGRSDTIARTELQTAQLESAKNRYAASGLVDHVRIADGDGDAICAARNGKTVPLTEAPSLAHPNCRVAIIPVLREGVV